MRRHHVAIATLLLLAATGCSTAAPDSGLKEPVKMPDQVGDWQRNTMVQAPQYSKPGDSSFINFDHQDKLSSSEVKNGKNVSGALCGAHASDEKVGYCVIKIGDGGYEVYGDGVSPDQMASFMQEFMQEAKA